MKIRKYKKIVYVITLVLSLGILSACGETDPTADAGDAADTSQNDATIQAISELTPNTQPETGSRVMTINRTDTIPAQPLPVSIGEVSVSEPIELDVKVDDTLPDEPEKEELKPGTYSGNGTPLVFDVADCTITAFGSFDNGMSDSIFSAINEYRKNGGLPLIEKNQSLRFCADCRAKEISYSFNHIRENGTYWFTVAPDYFKAELLATDFSTAQETVDAWMQTATGRQYLLSEDLGSIGISTFKSGGRSYFVCALGD